MDAAEAWKRALMLATICASSVSLGRAAGARDLPKRDPARAAILDSVRRAPGEKFIVKDLVRFGDFAYLCALVRDEKGFIQNTDGGLDINQWVLMSDGSRWLAMSSVGGFAADARHVDCAPSFRSDVKQVSSVADVERIFVDELRSAIQRDLQYDQLSDANLALDVLRSKEPSFDVSLDGAKSDIIWKREAVHRTPCSSPACREKGPILKELTAVRDDPSLSALQWNWCETVGLRADSLEVTKRCAADPAARRACHTGMNLPRDRLGLDACRSELERACLEALPRKACLRAPPAAR
jgi:hypothetical protein